MNTNIGPYCHNEADKESYQCDDYFRLVDFCLPCSTVVLVLSLFFFIIIIIFLIWLTKLSKSTQGVQKFHNMACLQLLLNFVQPIAVLFEFKLEIPYTMEWLNTLFAMLDVDAGLSGEEAFFQLDLHAFS